MQTGETDKTTAGTLKTKRELGTHKTIKSEHNKEPDQYDTPKKKKKSDIEKTGRS